MVPGEMGASALPAEARQGKHFPDVFETVLQWLKTLPEAGSILVAAGICGKVYVGHAKRQGLCAIDIGAMADLSWALRQGLISSRARSSNDASGLLPGASASTCIEGNRAQDFAPLR